MVRLTATVKTIQGDVEGRVWVCSEARDGDET